MTAHLTIASVFLFLGTLSLWASDEAFTYGRWQSCQAGGGGYVNTVAVSRTDHERMFAALDVSGLARSDDGGSTWHMLGGLWPQQQGVTGARDVDIDPRDRDAVLAVLGNQWDQSQAGVWRSVDGGRSWVRAIATTVAGDEPHRAAGRILARSPHDPARVLVATIGAGVAVSTDSGATWSIHGPTGVHGTGITWDPHHPQRVWLATQATTMEYGKGDGTFSTWTCHGGFFVSENGGLDWRQLSEQGPSEVVADPTAQDWLWGLREDRVVLSRDAGLTWEAADIGLPALGASAEWVSDGRFLALAAGPDYLLAGPSRGSGVYRTASGKPPAWTLVKPARPTVEEAYGRPWFRVPGWDGSSRSTLVVTPGLPNLWFSTDWFGIYRSDDAGTNWRLAINGIENTCLHHLLQDPSDPGVVHLAMADNGYLRSVDGGQTFNRAGTGLSNNVKTLALCPLEPRRIYATATAQWFWRADLVYVSIDRGDTWTRSPMTGIPEFENRRCNSIDVNPADPYDVYLGVAGLQDDPGNGVYRSRDGGQSWTDIGEGLPRVKGLFRTRDIWGIGRELACDAQGGLILISHELGSVWRRKNGEKTWTKSDFPGTAPTTVVADWKRPQRFWVLANGVWLTEDGGSTWVQRLEQPSIALRLGDAGHLAVDRVHPERLAIGTPKGPFLSIDDGVTWKPIGQDLPNRLGNLVAFSGERLLAGSTGNGAFLTTLSAGGSAMVHAKPIPGPAWPQKIEASADARAVLGDWSVVWRGHGTVETHATGISLAGPGEGSVARSIPLELLGGKISGKITVTGAISHVLVAIEGFDAAGKQTGWTTLLDASNLVADTPLLGNVVVPSTSQRVQVVLLASGTGKVLIDDLVVNRQPSVFLLPMK